jgi:hypothetical protein
LKWCEKRPTSDVIYDRPQSSGTARSSIENLRLPRLFELFAALMRITSESDFAMHKDCAKQLFFAE